MSDLTTILRIMGMPRCIEAADALEQAEKMCDAYANENQQFSDTIIRLTAESDALRASVAAIHHRVCRGGDTHGMRESIAIECETAVPSLRDLRA